MIAWTPDAGFVVVKGTWSDKSHRMVDRYRMKYLLACSVLQYRVVVFICRIAPLCPASL